MCPNKNKYNYRPMNNWFFSLYYFYNEELNEGMKNLRTRLHNSLLFTFINSIVKKLYSV